ncbi:hypothetical protein [Microbispora sp. NPDC049125]|uniref:hypothetical protein n=1 Tax=Microbispora sp. NPDC049125 TaxID=3154929 RepID=UPI003466901B
MKTDEMPLGRRFRRQAPPLPEAEPAPQAEETPQAADAPETTQEKAAQKRPKPAWLRVMEDNRRARKARNITWWDERPPTVREQSDYFWGDSFKINTPVPIFNGIYTFAYRLFGVLYGGPATLIGNALTYANQRPLRATAFWIGFYIFSRATGLNITFD